MTTRDLKIKVLIPKKKIQLQNKGLGKKEANKWRLHGKLALNLIVNNGRGRDVEFLTA